MGFEPDIVVHSRDGFDRFLVVEAKWQLADEDIATAEHELKRYMTGYRYPIGVMITPDTLRLYRDTFLSADASSVERVGEYSMVGVLDPDVLSTVRVIEQPQLRAFRLEDAVQSWLSTLNDPMAVNILPSGLREAVEEHIVPAVMQGEVRAAGPRWQRNRTGT